LLRLLLVASPLFARLTITTWSAIAAGIATPRLIAAFGVASRCNVGFRFRSNIPVYFGDCFEVAGSDIVVRQSAASALRSAARSAVVGATLRTVLIVFSHSCNYDRSCAFNIFYRRMFALWLGTTFCALGSFWSFCSVWTLSSFRTFSSLCARRRGSAFWALGLVGSSFRTLCALARLVAVASAAPAAIAAAAGAVIASHFAVVAALAHRLGSRGCNDWCGFSGRVAK